jgi:hypothetical protein
MGNLLLFFGNFSSNIRLLVIDTIAGICNEFIGNGQRGLTGVDTMERKNFLVRLSA